MIVEVVILSQNNAILEKKEHWPSPLTVIQRSSKHNFVAQEMVFEPRSISSNYFQRLTLESWYVYTNLE